MSGAAPRGAVAPELRRQLRLVATSGVGVLVVTAVGLSGPQRPAQVTAWLSLALVCWGFVLWQCARRLHLNCSDVSGHLYERLGPGNLVTLLRGLLISATAGFLAIAPDEPSPGLLYLPAALYTAAALGDWLDGELARRRQQTTRLGAELDTVLDAFGLLIAPLLAVMHDKLHISYLLVSIAYYLFQWGIRWRKRRGRPVHPLPPSRLRRHLAGLQMALVAFALWPPVPGSVSSILGVFLMLPLLFGFGRDWMAVSGRRGVGAVRGL